MDIRTAFIVGFTAVLISLSASVAIAKEPLSDAQIKKILIQQSLDSYPGNCPCPYNTDRAGRSCGRRSAYSKPGGYAPLCYPDDVSPEIVEEYRKNHE